MSIFLSDIELSDYQADGYLVRENIFSAAEVALFRSAAEQAEHYAQELTLQDANPSLNIRHYSLDGAAFTDIDCITVQFEHREPAHSVRVIEPVNEISAALNKLIDEPRLTQPMRQIIGVNDLALWTAKLNLKPAREGSGFRWHQDSPYWIHDCQHVDDLPNVMVLFDDADESNGCLRIIRGSHLKGRLPGSEDGSQLQGFFTHPDGFSERDQVLMEAPEGSVVFFDPNVVHGSTANLSDRPRKAMIITYQPAGYAALKSGLIRQVSRSLDP